MGPIGTPELISTLLHFYNISQEKMAILQENETLRKDSDHLKTENDSLMKTREAANSQVAALKRSLEVTNKDIKEKEKMVIAS